ncbi:hypothetical protein AAP_02050 [Ascosphaera apis ARSEF 7405]|uniref:Uncharacterized protein n=1 Tax=Ascosphaera apis ARSEF 7405 TaxID=392613 RepID=A0A168AIC3_9EURO|nr:hypothetical protein AAP_02050 [Ascosphaera apis ARSEF 7405]
MVADFCEENFLAMARRTRRGGPTGGLVALPSDQSELEEEEYRSSDAEEYSNSGPRRSGSESDDEGDEGLEAEDRELVRSAARKRKASGGNDDKEISAKKQKSEPKPVRKKRGIAQRIKKPRAGQPAPKKKPHERVEDGNDLAETSASSEGKAEEEKRANESTETPPVSDEARNYKTQRNVPVPVVDDDDEF